MSSVVWQGGLDKARWTRCAENGGIPRNFS